MGILSWVLLGGIAGWLATIVMGKDASFGILANIVIGIVGGLLGGFLFNLFGGAGVTGFNLYSLLVAIVGSVVLLWIVSLFKRAA